ncbi:hypothetical protein [Kutzneria chonburiensis]|uniref:Uncharacterized protein n=1 Tax=Kutzneria chonburiensis TaxID=1483604 RepID=A0ABV6N3P9_9PSEU|nr:hypothetical protein [Kutzneria chonburiensis]
MEHLDASALIVRLQDIVDSGHDPKVVFYSHELRQYLPVGVVTYDPQEESGDVIELSSDL